MPDLSHLCPETDPVAIARGDLTSMAGWLGQDQTNRAIAEQLPTLSSDFPDAILAVEPNQPIYLYQAWYMALSNQEPAYKAQQIGSCVGHGHAHANDLLQCVEIALGEQTEYEETSAEWVYGASRRAGNILGIFDGSYGSAAALAMTRDGIMSRKQLGPELGADSGSLAKLWGRRGPDSSFLDEAANFKVRAVAKITNIPSAISCLWNGSPFTSCSNQGFTMIRDSTGACRASGRWAHCMFICGWRPSDRKFLIVQSWGPNTPSGPQVDNQPSFTFWADESTVLKMLRQDDSWGLFSAPDFKKRQLPSEFFNAA